MEVVLVIALVHFINSCMIKKEGDDPVISYMFQLTLRALPLLIRFSMKSAGTLITKKKKSKGETIVNL